MINGRDISVIISTYNRSRVLRLTLEAMCNLDREGLDVVFIVVDNNSTDNTPDVIESFKERIPIHQLFQSKQGKSAALNLALDSESLGDIVAFTDDDVLPGRDWLKRMAWACATWPEYRVFGGGLYNVWPNDTKLPSWARNPEVAAKFFSCRESLGRCTPYPENQLPTGANFWVRKALIQQGFRFDELLGSGNIPRTGEDTAFLRALRASGNTPFFVTDAALGHMVQADRLRKSAVRRLAFRRGRSAAYKEAAEDGLGPRRVLRRSTLRGVLALTYRCAIARLSSLPTWSERVFIISLQAWWDYGYASELLRLEKTAETPDWHLPVTGP